MTAEQLGVQREFRNPNILFHLATRSFTSSQSSAQAETSSALPSAPEEAEANQPVPAASEAGGTPRVLTRPPSTITVCVWSRK